MKRALCLIREALVYRRGAFLSGLRNAEYRIVETLNDPVPGDVLVIWNRYGANENHATRFERASAQVVVVENGYLGKSWLGDRWFALSLGQHNGGGQWNVGSNDRWDSLTVPLAPWRRDGTETIILAQRGIGSASVRSPDNWAASVQKKIGGRIRPHPGKHDPTVLLEDDLRHAKCVITWASSAALSALEMGVPVWYAYDKWIGGEAGRSLTDFDKDIVPHGDRIAMFRKLIWAMWRASEIEDGTAFRTLCG